MQKRLVILIPLQPLLSEGLQRIFQKLDDVELRSLPCDDIETLDSCLDQLRPDMVLLTANKEDDAITLLMSKILRHYEDIPIVWVDLESNNLRLYTSHTLTANSAALLQAIREIDVNKTEIYPIENQKKSNP
jgi:chemotaxis response regulator CheB